MRVLDRILVLLLALLVSALGGILVLEAVRAATSQPGLLVDRGSIADVVGAGAWSDPGWVTGAVVVAAVGLVLVVIELRRRRAREYTTRGGDRRRRVTYGANGLERLVEQTALQHDDVASVGRTKVRNRKVRVEVFGFADVDTSALGKQVEQRVEQRLTGLDLKRRPKVGATAVRGERRAR